MVDLGAETLGQRVTYARMFRADGRLTQSDLARLAGIAPNNLGLIERDVTHNPSARVLHRIASVLGVTVEWLLTGEGEHIKEG